MPSTEYSENPRPCKPQTLGAAPPEQEHLPCPRCDSTNTKFCYYNNYNFSQPRHFCKSCRRYWTQGGTLRDIPVGGGSRKNAKRSRTSTATSSTAVTLSSVQDHPLPATPVLLPIVTNQGVSVQFGATGTIDGDSKSNMNVGGSFTSLLSPAQGPSFLALGAGFGLGPGHGFEDMGFGLGRGGWPFQGVVDGCANANGSVVATGLLNSWQLESGEGVFVGGDCFSWPGLAISTPGNGLK